MSGQPFGKDSRQGDRILDALEHLRLEGAIYLRGRYTESWALADQGGSGFAGMIHPGANRVILFHVVANGSCWISLASGERRWASDGDVIVVPYGDHHTMGGVEPATPVSIMTLITPPPWDTPPVIRHGRGGPRTDIVCGYLYSADPLFDPRLRALPPVFVVRPPPGPAAEWVKTSIAYALELSEDTPASTRLPEALLIEVLRLHIATTPAAEQGWMAALRDPVLAPAMALIHEQPERKWTVTELASEVAVSRSYLDNRFRDVLGLSPIRYLTGWRMHLALDLLAGTDATVGVTARRVGYETPEAFSRAFKRAHGKSPSHWREADDRPR